MTKFVEICQAFAKARQTAMQSHQDCMKFVQIFVQKMSEYYVCPIEVEPRGFDKDGLLHFSIFITLYEKPEEQKNSPYEIIKSSWTVEKVIDNYILTIFPWVNTYQIFLDRQEKFIEIFDFLYDKIIELYRYQYQPFPTNRKPIRDFWGFDHEDDHYHETEYPHQINSEDDKPF
jgi:hypothetical protein